MYLRAPLRAPRQCPAQRLPVLARRGSKWAFYGTRLNTRLPLTGKKPNVGTKSGKYSAFFDSLMKPLGCAPYPQTRRHPRTAGGADAPHLCTSKRYDPKADELLLETDAVDVVVKATVARAGQIAAATENSIAEPAPSTAETSAGSPVPMFGRAAWTDGELWHGTWEGDSAQVMGTMKTTAHSSRSGLFEGCHPARRA